MCYPSGPPEVSVSSGVSIATGFCTSAAGGILIALLLPPFQELRRFFFAFNASLALALLGAAAAMRDGIPAEAPEGAARLASVAVWISMALAVAYVAALYLPGRRQARGLLLAATAAALLAAGADGWQTARPGGPGWMFAAEALAAAGLLGTVIVAMILGHWYLVRPRLPVSHLVRFSLILGGAISVRAALCVAGLTLAGASSAAGLGATLMDLAVHRGFFFWQRVFFGIVGPAAFAYMIHETARIKSTQSATGILYIAVIFVVIGEFLARYLAVSGAGPM